MRAAALLMGAAAVSLSLPERTSPAALMRMVPSGLRMSWPRMPMNSSADVPVCLVYRPTDSAMAWSMASLKRVRSVRSSGPVPPPWRAQIFSTLARSARYSVIIASTAKPATMRKSACVSACVSAGVGSDPRGPRPLPLASCCAGDCGWARSAAIVLRISAAWSRSATASSGWPPWLTVAANSSQASRISPAWVTMNSDRRGRAWRARKAEKGKSCTGHLGKRCACGLTGAGPSAGAQRKPNQWVGESRRSRAALHGAAGPSSGSPRT